MQNKIFVSTGLTGKLAGIDAISVSAFNPICDAFVSDAGNVCASCYARKYESFRPSVKAAYERNSRALSTDILFSDEVPTINTAYFRFNSFGEILNTTHYLNLRTIAGANPQTMFALWTKRRLDLWGYLQRPANLIHILSSLALDKPVTPAIPVAGPDGQTTVAPTEGFWDYEFTVYRHEADIPAGAFLCKGRRCLECLHCYTKGNNFHVAEVLK